MSLTKTVSPGRETRAVQDHVECASEFLSGAPETATGEYSVEVSTSIDAVETLRPVLSKWANTLDTDIDYFLHQVRQDPAAVQPYVITVYHDGVARAMLVGQIRNRKASAVVSFVNISGPAERVLVIRKGGRMGQPSSAADRLLALELLEAMKRGAADSLCFERLPLQSGLYREIQRLPGFLVRERVPYVFCYSMLSLSDSGKKPPRLLPRKTMREMRRKTRILERAFPGQVSMKCFSEPAELEAGMRDALRVAVTTWQYYLGRGMNDTARMRETYRFFAERGWLRIYVLYVNGFPCAFLAGQLYNDTFHCQFAGYHPNYARLSVGSVLTARAFEQLAAAGVQRVDLGEGGQEHNRRLGCQMSEEGTVHVYSPTLRGVCLSLFFGITQVLRAGGRRTRSALKLKRLGRVWARYILSKVQT
jgi:hypothetical protein